MNKLHEADIGQYVLGPVATETGPKFGMFPKVDLRGGPVAVFEGRDTAIAEMRLQLEADDEGVSVR